MGVSFKVVKGGGMANRLIVNTAGADKATDCILIKRKLKNKGHSVHIVTINFMDKKIVWDSDNGPRSSGKLFHNLYYDKVIVIGHSMGDTELGDTDTPFNAGIVVGALFQEDLKPPEVFNLISCEAAKNSHPGNALAGNIGFSLGQYFAICLGEVGWRSSKLHAYTMDIAVVSEDVFEMDMEICQLLRIQPTYVLPVGSKYIEVGGERKTYGDQRDLAQSPKSIKGSKFCFYFNDYLLCCKQLY